MAKPDQELSRNAMRVLQAVLTSVTIAEAAEQAELSERSIYRYLADPGFQERLRQEQDAVLSRITGGLLSLSERALQALAQVLDDEASSPATRARTAGIILSHCQSMLELRELAQRLIYLEERVLVRRL